MLNLESKEQPKFQIKIITNIDQILKYLQLGISIPILPEFKEFIIKAFTAYKVKALILEEKIKSALFKENIDNVNGISIVYDDGFDRMFFGFFGIYDHNEEKITFLIDSIIKYAKENNYKYIRGPVNIPAVIFGWGFMEEGSNKSLFICCPVNPPIYQQLFIKKGFYVKFEEDRYHVIALKINPNKLRKKNGNYYDFSNYEYLNPSKEEIWNLLDKMIELHVKYMPPSAQISPIHPINAQIHVEFIHKFGKESNRWAVYHKPTKEMVACGYIVPNPFSKDKKNRINSASFHDWVVHPDHRRSGLAIFMFGCTSQKVYPEGIRWGSWPVGSENIANASAAQKMGGVRDRRHIILEYRL